jgi:hypothetical protein
MVSVVFVCSRDDGRVGVFAWCPRGHMHNHGMVVFDCRAMLAVSQKVHSWLVAHLQDLPLLPLSHYWQGGAGR